MTITFLEAYAQYGRDSAAIAEACAIDESEAYNLMAARVDVERGILPDAERRERQREASQKWRERNKAVNAALRREARG